MLKIHAVPESSGNREQYVQQFAALIKNAARRVRKVPRYEHDSQAQEEAEEIAAESAEILEDVLARKTNEVHADNSLVEDV